MMECSACSRSRSFLSSRISVLSRCCCAPYSQQERSCRFSSASLSRTRSTLLNCYETPCRAHGAPYFATATKGTRGENSCVPEEDVSTTKERTRLHDTVPIHSCRHPLGAVHRQ